MPEKLTDIGSERAVLASLCQYGASAHVAVCDVLDEESFANSNNKIIYRCINHVLQNDQAPDIASIISAAEQLDLLESVNTKQELKYISSLYDFPVDEANLLKFAAQIKKFDFARKIQKLTKKIHTEVGKINGTEKIDDIIGILENPVTDFLREDSGEGHPDQIGLGVEEYVEFLRENKCDIIGVPTGFKRYDEAIGGGLRRKCVDLVSARPKVGKSVFADNVALNVASTSTPVLVLDTEMSKEDHLNRLLANISGVPINEIATGKFTENKTKDSQVSNAVETLSSVPYFYASVAGKPFDQILNLIKRWVAQEVKTDDEGRTNECVIIYDYLKLMSSSSITNNIQEYQALGFQITSLHNLCVKLDVPCLSFVQLNRDGITKESTDAVSGSDRLIWLCTSFSIFKSKSTEEIAEDGPNSGNRKLVPIVSRHGAGMNDGDYINMQMEGSHAKLIELASRNEMQNNPTGDTGLIDTQDLEDIKNNGLEETEKQD